MTDDQFTMLKALDIPFIQDRFPKFHSILNIKPLSVIPDEKKSGLTFIKLVVFLLNIYIYFDILIRGKCVINAGALFTYRL